MAIDFSRQCYYKSKEVSPNKLSRLIRQQAAIDESMPPAGRRGSQPTLSPDPDDGGGYRLSLQPIRFSVCLDRNILSKLNFLNAHVASVFFII